MRYRNMYDSAGGFYPKGVPKPVFLVPINGDFAEVDGIPQLEYIKENYPDAWCVQYAAVDQEGVAVYDIEPGCIWPPSQAALILKREVAAGHRPTAYASFDTMNILTAELAPVGLAIGIDHRIDGVLANPQQFADNLDPPPNMQVPYPFVGAQWSWGQTYDTSLVLPTWGALRPRGGTNQP
jgi:hypothetical protein